MARRSSRPGAELVSSVSAERDQEFQSSVSSVAAGAWLAAADAGEVGAAENEPGVAAAFAPTLVTVASGAAVGATTPWLDVGNNGTAALFRPVMARNCRL